MCDTSDNGAVFTPDFQQCYQQQQQQQLYSPLHLTEIKLT